MQALFRRSRMHTLVDLDQRNQLAEHLREVRPVYLVDEQCIALSWIFPGRIADLAEDTRYDFISKFLRDLVHDRPQSFDKLLVAHRWMKRHELEPLSVIAEILRDQFRLKPKRLAAAGRPVKDEVDGIADNWRLNHLRQRLVILQHDWLPQLGSRQQIILDGTERLLLAIENPADVLRKFLFIDSLDGLPISE